ncbi:MAG: YciI family protein [Acidobacteriaceae bacterium]|nr:YciI family protein [Acidobacteriaceae bacterium]
MRYMFLIYSQEMPGGIPPEELDALRAGHSAVMQDAREKGVLLGVDALKPTSTATTVRVSDGRSMTTDGPFAETKEQLAGYYMLECRDLDEAIDWARRIPTACKGTAGCIEIRPVADLSKL